MLTRLILRLMLISSLSASFAILVMVSLDLSIISLQDYNVDNNADAAAVVEPIADDTKPDSPEVLDSKNSMWYIHPAPFHEFKANEPKSVIILTYQRSGSSFFGQMFNSNPYAFYMFEPLDALYSALYGTAPGWNVPSDLTSFSNGSMRILPKNEVAAVSSFLRNVFTCNVDSLPTESVSHRYWTKFGGDHAASLDYVQCLRKRNLTLVPCHENTTQYCGRRFGEKPAFRLNECNRLLWSAKYRSQHGDGDVRNRFESYRLCTAELRSRIESECMALLKSDCSNRSLRAVKSVRATMDSMESLLQKLPNLRIIHLIRDPRAVALSRSEFDSSARGMFANMAGAQKMVTEAMLYCRTAAHDVHIRQRLARLYPGRIYPLMYDDVVRDLAGHTRNVYHFLGEKQLPGKTLKWIGNNSRRKRNGTTIASRWQDTLTVRQSELILSVCSELFRLLRQSPAEEIL